MTDPRTPCLVGVGQQTWHPDDVGDAGAPEPLEMWETVARAAAEDSGAGAAALERLDALDIVYCQTWQYDDPPGRLAGRLHAEPRRRYYSGIGGTTPQVLVQDTAARILAGESDVALVLGAEALATQRRYKKRGERYPYSFKPAEKRPYPWEAPFHPAELAHEVMQAWLTFAVFDNARRAHVGTGLAEYRTQLGDTFAPMTEIAAKNPRAWFPIERTVDEIVAPTAENRMVGYPYTKYMISIMDVDMAAALLLMSHEAAERLGIPAERRIYPRGWCYITDPTYVAEHDQLFASPAMVAASREAMRVAGIGIDDVAHLDLYSCFGSSLNFARDALGLAPGDRRGVTVTGGLPYHGGAGSNYMTHSIATMAEKLRSEPGSVGLVSGVGMHMTKHVYGVYATEPGRLTPPDQAVVQQRVEAEHPARLIVTDAAGTGTVAAYSVVHGREGPETGVLICDVDGGRAYATVREPEALADAEDRELIGRQVRLSSRPVSLPTGQEGVVNSATPI